MPLCYILDGYNIIKNSEFNKVKTLKDQRYALIRMIQEKKPFGSKNSKITIVFDGKSDVLGHPLLSVQNIEVIFTQNESADEWIKRRISKARSADQMVVVTDDKEILFFIRSYSAKAMKVEDFLRKLKPKEIPQEFTKPELSFSEINRINEELRKIWLKE
ncbi:MAG: NYN domain-containing protein [Candidatus Omnitrophica bacterium]|nr:NYN domain-containing protein [Candidatus Omnitrophota bacterium]